jgi:hypothetical protein
MLVIGAIWDWALHKIGKFVPTPGNILQTMADAALDGLKSLVDMIQSVLVHPPRPHHGQWLDSFYGQSYGFSPLLAMAVAVIVTALAMFRAGKFERVFHAWFVVIAIAIGLKPWYGFCTWVVKNIRDPLCVWASHLYEPTDTHRNGIAALLDVVNPFGILGGAGAIVVTGWILILIVTLYELMIIGVTFGAPLAFALSAVGSRAQAVLHWVVSIGIVSMTIGAPIAIAFLEVGEYCADNAPLHSITMIAVFYLLASLVGGIYAQYRLLKATNQGLQNVTGRALTKGKSVVSGTVKTQPAGRQDVRIKEDHANTRAATLMGAVMASVPEQPSSGTGKFVRTAHKGVAAATAARTGGVSIIANKGMERLEKRATARANGTTSNGSSNGGPKPPSNPPGPSGPAGPSGPSRPAGPTIHARPQSKGNYGSNGLPKLPDQ